MKFKSCNSNTFSLWATWASKCTGSLLFLCLLLLIISGCVDEPVRDQSDNKFVNLSTFIEGQATLLDSLNPKVTKKVLINGKQEQQTLQDINWAKELVLFLQADISKPALQASYQVEEVSTGVRIYKPREEENPDIQYLKVSFEEGTNTIISVEALISRTNYLYHSEKKISLQCRKNTSGHTQIAAYQINGYQKLILGNKVPYQVEARVL